MSGGRTKTKADPTDARYGTVATLERLQRLRPREAKFPFIDDDEVIARHTAARKRVQVAEEVRRKRLDRLILLLKDSAEDDVIAKATELLDAPDPDVEAARRELGEAEAAVEAATSHIVFRSPRYMTPEGQTLVGRPAYDALLAEHPPTKEQKETFGLDLDYNTQTFPLALIAACAAEPNLTVEDVQKLHDEDAFNGADLQAMFNLCVLLCTTRRSAAVGKG